MSLPSLELICFGPPAARVAGRDPPREVLWRKHLALLIHLALSPNRTRTRQHLVGMLWPERTERHAQRSLNEAIRRLRTCLGASRLASHADSITLDDVGLGVDAMEFERAAPTEPQRALALLAGEFLEGFTVADAPAFDEWASGERSRYRAKAVTLLTEEGERALASGRFGDALDLARRALAQETYSEPATRLMMRAAALAGDSAGALAAYHGFATRLKAELAEGPSRELVALAERIRGQRWRRVSAKHADTEPPLVDRGQPYRAAFSLVADGMKHGPQTLVIAGDTGVGRTRLLAECTDRMTLEGAVVVVARPLATDHDAPWSTLRSLMRAGLINAPGVAAAAPSAIAVLAALVPELAERAAPQEPRDRAQVAGALASLLRAASEEGPLGLAIDDAHLADSPTIGVLHQAVGSLSALPVVCIVTSPRAPRELPPELLALRRDVAGALPGTAVELQTLGETEVRMLAASLSPWCKDDRDLDRLARRVAFETGGNPFLAVSLLRALSRFAALRSDALVWPLPQTTYDAPLPISVPSLARMAIVARVTGLERETQHYLATASVLGLAFDLDLMASLVAESRGRLEEKLPEMEQANLVVFDGERYAFAAPLLAQVIRSEFLTAGQRRTVELRAIALLASQAGLEARVLRAELLAHATPGPDAFREATTVARAAVAAGTLRTARRALGAAERALETAAGPERYELDQLLAQLNRAGPAPESAT